jgi:predicted amino acid-binding ACT domain protein
MAEEVRQVEHYSVSCKNKAGEGARVLGPLRDAGVNLIAFWGYPTKGGRARLELVPEDGAALLAAAKLSKLKLSKKQTAFLIQGDDRAGVVADVLAKLAAAKINAEAVQGVAVAGGRFGVVLFLTPAASRKAVSVLGAL